jgi:NADPH2:quinone reductase
LIAAVLVSHETGRLFLFSNLTGPMTPDCCCVMKAIRVHEFGGPEKLQLEEIPTPSPGADEVLVRVHAIGVNPVETYIRSGSNPALKLPYTPGMDAVGVVEKVGANVKARGGERVYTSSTISGAYAEFALCREGDVHPLPANLSFVQGAAINIPYATAYRALFQRGAARKGETVLIHGASGGVGVAATQLARNFGLRIIGTAGTDRGLKLVRDQGAHLVLDHHAPDYLEKAMVFTEGKGMDLIIEMLANVNLGKDLPLLAPSGRVVVVGSRGKVEIMPRDLMSREADVRGLMLFNASAAELKEIHSALHTAFESNALEPIIGKKLPLASATQAHVDVMSPGAYGKIVLVPDLI